MDLLEALEEGKRVRLELTKSLDKLDQVIHEQDIELVNTILIGDERLWIYANVESISRDTVKEILKKYNADTIKCSKNDMYEIADKILPFVLSKLLKTKIEDNIFTDNYTYHYLFYKDNELVSILKAYKQ